MCVREPCLPDVRGVGGTVPTKAVLVCIRKAAKGREQSGKQPPSIVSASVFPLTSLNSGLRDLQDEVNTPLPKFSSQLLSPVFVIREPKGDRAQTLSQILKQTRTDKRESHRERHLMASSAFHMYTHVHR